MRRLLPIIAVLALAVSSPAQVLSGAGGIVFNGGISGKAQGTISTPVVVTSPSCSPLPNGTALTSYSVTFTATGGTGPYSFAVVSGAAPGGIGFSGPSFTGTPTTSNTYSFGVRATDALGAVSAIVNCQVTIQTSGIPPVTITTTPTQRPNGIVGVPLTDAFSASGGTPPYQWSVPAGTIPTGAEDILDYALMPVGVRSAFHLTGTAAKYFRLDAGLIWWLKGASGGPWDGEALGSDYVKQWITEGPTFNNLSGYKMYRTPVSLWKRYHVPGADDVVYTPGPNIYDTTESCGSDNLAGIDNLGVRGELTGPFTDVLWTTTFGGDIPDHTPYLLAQKWIKCTANNIANCTTEEDYWLVKGWGQVRWVPKSCSAGVCTPTSSGSVNTNEVAGGAPVPNFACSLPNVPVQGTLPPGVLSTASPELDLAANTGAVSGTPTTPGTYNYTIQVEDSAGNIAQKNFQTIINPAGTSGPPTYLGSRTDLANAVPPLPIPNVGNLTGFNTIVTPTGFGNRVVRVTDTQAITPNYNGSWVDNCGGSGDENLWNTDSTMFIVQNEGCFTFPVGFNPATMQATKIYANLFPSGAFSFGFNSFWSRTNRNTLYFANGVTVQKYDFTDWLSGPKTTPPTPTTVIDFTRTFNSQHNGLPAGFVSLSTSIGGPTANDTLGMAYSSTNGQGSSGFCYVLAYSPVKGIAMWNTCTGAVTTDPGYSGGAGLTCNANGCTGTISTSDRFTIHKLDVHQNNSWFEVTGTLCLSVSCNSGFPDGPYFWQIGTTNSGWMGEGGRVGGHITGGYTKLINTPGSNHVWQHVIRTVGQNTQPDCTTGPYCFLIPLASFPTLPGSGVGITDEHKGWNNADAGDTFPFFWTAYAHAAGGPANNFVQVPTPAAATKIRSFEINRRTGCIYLADETAGFFVSCDKGATWNQRNTGLVTTFGWTVWYDQPRDRVIFNTYSASGAINAYYSTVDDGLHWTPITIPTTTTTGFGSFTGGAIAGDGSSLIGQGHGFGGSGGTAWSTNGTSYTQSVVPANGTCTAPGGAWSLFNDPINNAVWLGTEQCGVYKSTDNGHNFTPCSVAEVGFPGGIRDGNAESVAVDPTGNIFVAAQGGLWKASGASCPVTFTNVFGNSNTSEGRSVYIDSRGAIYYGHKQDTNAPVCPPSCTNPTNGGTTPLYQSLDGGATWTPFSTGLPSTFEPWREIESPFDHQLYVYIQNPNNTAVGTLWVTVQASGTVAPYGWQNEVLATSPNFSGKTWRFTPTFNTTLSQLFQTQVAAGSISQDGKFYLFNSDWFNELGSESGKAGCLAVDATANPGIGNCRGDVFAVELK